MEYKESFFYNKGSEALAQVAPRGDGCPILGDNKGQASHLMELWVSLCCRGVGPDGL